MKERIEHNLKYNDDTIFDNISIFRDCDDSGIILLPHKKKLKDVHPLLLRKKLIEEGKDPDELDKEEDDDNNQIE
jgi:hypothetical protein